MGYCTDFQGALKFSRKMVGKELFIIKQYLGEDLRDHPEWGDFKDSYGYGMTHMDFDLSSDFNGIEWNGSEKTYYLTEKVNILIKLVQKDIPDFSLEGQLIAQGEEWDDRWILKMKDNVAFKEDVVIVGDKVTCPECDCEFVVNFNKED